MIKTQIVPWSDSFSSQCCIHSAVEDLHSGLSGLSLTFLRYLETDLNRHHGSLSRNMFTASCQFDTTTSPGYAQAHSPQDTPIRIKEQLSNS